MSRLVLADAGPPGRAKNATDADCTVAMPPTRTRTRTRTKATACAAAETASDLVVLVRRRESLKDMAPDAPHEGGRRLEEGRRLNVAGDIAAPSASAGRADGS